MHRKTRSRAQSVRRVIVGIITVLIFAHISISLVSAETSTRHLLRVGGLGSGAGLSKNSALRLTSTLGYSRPGGMVSEEYSLGGSLFTEGLICVVDFDDFTIFADQWLETGFGLKADLDNDRDVDYGDLKRLADLWLGCCPRDWSLR